MELVYPSHPVIVLPRATAENPYPEFVSYGETVPIVTESGEVTGRAERGYAHSGTFLLHPVVHLHIISRMERIYLQRRSPSKDLFPGYWDTAVGGHVSFGEGIMEALYREAGEELGMSDFTPQPLDTYVHENTRERELVCSFACVGESFRPQPDGVEVVEGRWFPFEEVASLVGKDVLTPNFEDEFTRLLPKMKALL